MAQASLPRHLAQPSRPSSHCNRPTLACLSWTQCKKPTSLYLAMQCGLKVANYPLIPEDFERRQLPPALVPYRAKIFGLTIQPERLSEIRNERRPNSRYASLQNCRHEVSEAEAMMRRAGIRWLSTTTKSIEEIATTILQEVRPERLVY